MSAEYERQKSKGVVQVGYLNLVAFLDHDAVRHIEVVREKNPKHDVVFKLVIDIVYVRSNVVLSHLHEVRLSELPEPMRGALESVRVGSRGERPESIIVYGYDPKFATTRTNIWVLSADGRPVVLNLNRVAKEVQYRIHFSDWIHDYLPKLGRRIFVIEVPATETKPEYEHLIRAVEDLELAFKQYREGRYGEAILTLRNIVMNHLLREFVEIEREGKKVRERRLDSRVKNLVLASVPEAYRDEYKDVIKAIEDILRSTLKHHLSKFVHLDTGKLLRMPLREDVEHLLMIITSTLKYLVALSTVKNSGGSA